MITLNQYVKQPSDLVTTYNEKKIGFLNIALRKSEEANYYLNLASSFRIIAEKHTNPFDLIEEDDLQISLCQAAGISTKAIGYLQPQDTKELLNDFVEKYLITSENENGYVDELINRYLLTQGDALGGRMRNIVGGIAGEKSTQNIISALKVRNYKFQYFDKNIKNWINGDLFSNENSRYVKALKWFDGDKTRLLYYDLTVPVVKKNIDIVLFNNSDINNKNAKEFKKFISNPNNYLALGELKGGIDPAGADEHWKTANTALSRIRDSFRPLNKDVYTLFIGAAIESSMAIEIYNQCKSKELSNCANLTKQNQLSDICDWLIKL